MVEKHNCTDASVTVRRRSSVTSGGRVSRHQSIARGTASSIAKMVRPQDHEQPHSHHHHHHNHDTKSKKKRNSSLTTKKHAPSKDEEDSRRNSWCPTNKKRISRLSPNNSDSHIVNASNDRMQYKRDSIDSLTTSTTASSHEEDHVPKPTRSIKPFPKILKSFKEDDALSLESNTPECKQKDNTDLILEKHPDDFHNAPHYMTRESCNSHPTSQPSLSKNTSSSDDDLPTTPVDHPSPCASPIPDYDHQMEKIEKSIQKEASIQLSFPCDIPFVLTNQLEGYLPEAITTYSNTIVHHTKQRDDKLCTDLSHQLWGEVEQETQWTRIKWNLSQWMGIGLGEIRDKDYDDEGRPKNIVISGLCVTTEPGLLPERLLQFHKQGLAHHTYLLELTRQKRREQFRMKSKKQWVPDTQVSTCEFSSNDAHPCKVRFNFFNRKHHCRSCGHIFCQSHSANRLPLFLSDDTGEWARVCDPCLYSRVKPFLK